MCHEDTLILLKTKYWISCGLTDMCTKHQLQRTTQSQSILSVYQMPGQFKLISVTLYFVIGSISNGTCQTWNGCTDSAQHSTENCLPSVTDGQWRCFCLHQGWHSSWNESSSHCREDYSDHSGELATDNSPQTREILQRLFAHTSQKGAWIGARTRPLYWNWLATQGVYNKWASGHPKGIGSPSNKHCMLYDMNYYDIDNYDINWQSSRCDEYFTDVVFCVWDGPCESQERGPLSSKCFLLTHWKRSQRQAVEYCQSQNMSLVSVTSYKIHEDVKHFLKKMDLWTVALPFWTSGTCLRWLWITDEEVSPVGQHVGWAGREKFAFEDMCMVFTSSGTWDSQSCTQYKPYICETVVDETEVIPRQTMAPFTQSTENYEATTLSKVTPTESQVSATVNGEVSRGELTSREEPKTTGITSPTTEGQHVSTQPPDNQSLSNGHQVALTAGATMAGIFCLLILLALTLFLLRRKQKMEKPTSHTCVHSDFPLNNMPSNRTIPSNATPNSGDENTAFQREAEYYNVPAACTKDKKKNGSAQDKYEERLSKDTNLQSKNLTESRTNQSRSTADLSDGIKTDKVEMVENDLYCSSGLPGRGSNTTDNTQVTAKIQNVSVLPLDTSRDTKQEGETAEKSDHQYYNLTKSPKQMGNVGVGMTYMVDNDIYVSSDESGHVSKSVPDMIDNDIYETADDDIKLPGQEKTQRSEPQLPYQKPQDTQDSKLQASTGQYELASPVIQSGNQGQEAGVVGKGVRNDLYASVNKPKPKQHTTHEKEKLV